MKADNRFYRPRLAAACCGALLVLCLARPAAAQYLRVRDICRVKGQEANTLHGLGLVVGLNGTGDGDRTTTRALARIMELMGHPVALDAQRRPQIEELKDVKNVATVFVTVTVPPEGARRGEQLSCQVHAISAKSLAGGQLLMTPLLGPRPGSTRIYAFAQGPLTLDENGPPTSGKVHGGCRLEENFDNAFVQDGKITLVLDKDHASFQTAYDIQEMLNDPQISGIEVAQGELAKARDQVNVEVQIPALYVDHPVEFVSQVLDMQIVPPRHDARVVIDERNGVIIIGDNVMVGRVAVAHGNVSIQTGNAPGGGPLLVVDQTAETTTTRLEALVDALNALKVDTQDIIDIIKNLKRSGDLYGKLIIE